MTCLGWFSARESREWQGTDGVSPCNRRCPLWQCWSLLPQMVGKWAGPSGCDRVADSDIQCCPSWKEVHKRIQTRIWASEAPSVDQMFVKRGIPLRSICLLGLSSIWWITSLSCSISVIVIGPRMSSREVIPRRRSVSFWSDWTQQLSPCYKRTWDEL